MKPKLSPFDQELQIQLQTPDGQAFEIPVTGCLGLLALGDVGLLAWRTKRLEHRQQLISKAKAKLKTNS